MMRTASTALAPEHVTVQTSRQGGGQGHLDGFIAENVTARLDDPHFIHLRVRSPFLLP